MSKLIWSGLGCYVGLLLNRRYKLPQFPTPSEICDRLNIPPVWNRINTTSRDEKEESLEETYKMWQRFKEFEREQRRKERQSSQRPSPTSSSPPRSGVQ